MMSNQTDNIESVSHHSVLAIEEIPDDESEGYLERSSGSSHYSHETS
jgi:hypothetical protein